MTRNGKKEYYQKYFSENKDNLQKVWKGIKELVNIKSKNYDVPTCLQLDDEHITNPTKVSNTFNKYFTSVAVEILKKRKYNSPKSYKDYLSNKLVGGIILDRQMSMLGHVLRCPVSNLSRQVTFNENLQKPHQLY